MVSITKLVKCSSKVLVYALKTSSQSRASSRGASWVKGMGQLPWRAFKNLALLAEAVSKSPHGLSIKTSSVTIISLRSQSKIQVILRVQSPSLSHSSSRLASSSSMHVIMNRSRSSILNQCTLPSQKSRKGQERARLILLSLEEGLVRAVNSMSKQITMVEPMILKPKDLNLEKAL